MIIFKGYNVYDVPYLSYADSTVSSLSGIIDSFHRFSIETHKLFLIVNVVLRKARFDL